jgi:predicted MFS family arabinose efflux permease
MSAKRNLQIITPYLVCSLEGVTHGLYWLWATVHQGIPMASATMAVAAGDLALLVLEVPTGVFADRLGAKRSLVLGSASQVVGLLLFWRARSAPTLVAAALTIALGDAFRHGADQALLYRSCAALGQPETFGRRFARAEAWALATVVGLTALGGWIVDRAGFDLAWALDVVLSLAGLALALAMTDLPATSGQPEGEEEGAAPPALASLAGRLPWGILVPVTLVGTLGSVAELFTQTTSRGGLGAQMVALVIAGALLLEALGAALVARGAVPIHPRALDAVALASVACLALTALSPAAIVPALIVLFLGAGMSPAIRGALVQRGAADSERATVASAASAVDMLGIAVGLPLAAWLHGRVGLPGTAAILGAVALLAWALSAVRRRPLA